MTSLPTDTSPTPDGEISLTDILLALKARFWLILALTILGGALGAAYALSLKPIFRATAVVSVVEEGGKGSGIGSLAAQFGGIAGLAGVNLSGSSSRTDALGTLNSRQLIESYIKDQNLLRVLYQKQWDESRNDWVAGLEKPPSLWDATETFTKGVRKITDDKKSGLITLTVEWIDAKVATQWANELVQRANKSLRERAIAKSEGNLAYLNAKLDTTSVVELRQAIYRLIEAEVKNVMIAQGSEEYAFKVIDPAVVAEKKVKPRRSLIAIMGAALGFMVGATVAFLRRPFTGGRI